MLRDNVHKSSSSNLWMTNGASGHLKRLDEYKDTVVRLFPALSRHYVEMWSISDIDALTLGCFLDCYPRKVVVLDIGTFLGVSAFHFAGQPKVSKVISVDPNLPIAYELNDKSDVLDSNIDPEPLQNLRAQDAARAVFAELGDEQTKIQLRVGTVGSTQVAVKDDSLESSGKVEVPTLEPSKGASLVAFVDGLHTKDGVQKDLEAIFEKNPRAIALLDDCRHYWGPFIQAGIVNFMETASQKYHFRLLGDLGPSLASSNLGIVYPEAEAAEVRQTLSLFSEMFSQRLDPLRLLSREEELISTVNRTSRELEQTRVQQETRNSQIKERNSQIKERNSQLEERNSQLAERNSQLAERNSQLEERNSQLAERNSQLKEHNSQLEEHNSQLTVSYSRRRYKLANAIANSVFRIPLIGRSMRRGANPPND